MKKYQNFDSFWPFYLRKHAKPATRNLHYIGTSLVVGIGLYSIITANWFLLFAMPVAGYFFAWIAHWRVERNRPATFTYPLWSLYADFKMWALWLAGRLKPELEKAGVEIHDVKKIFIHQANEKLDFEVVKRLYRKYKVRGIPEGVLPMSIAEFGNSSVATVPTLLDNVRKNRMEGHSINKGDIIMLAAVGAGMNINSIALCF